MLTKKPSNTTLLSHLRHELRTPINVIIGYSEMLLEDLEIANDKTNLDKLKQIRESALEILSLIQNLLNDEQFEFYQSDLARLLAEQNLQIQFQIPTNLIIQCCQQILNTTTNHNLASDIKKIKQAAQNLLAMTQMTWLISGNFDSKIS